MSSEKHSSLRERRKYFPASSPHHTADTSFLAAARPFSPVAERLHELRSDGASMLIPPFGFMFIIAAPFGSLKLAS
jgi:hypothetical protein